MLRMLVLLDNEYVIPEDLKIHATLLGYELVDAEPVLRSELSDVDTIFDLILAHIVLGSPYEAILLPNGLPTFQFIMGAEFMKHAPSKKLFIEKSEIQWVIVPGMEGPTKSRQSVHKGLYEFSIQELSQYTDATKCGNCGGCGFVAVDRSLVSIFHEFKNG